MFRHLRHHFHQILAKYRSPQNVSQLLQRVASNYPAKDAVVCDEVRLTFSQLNEQVMRVASGLSALGVRRGEWVAIMLPNCPEFVLSFLALAQLGAVVAPVDIYYRQPELESMLRDGHIRALITSSEFLEVVEPAVKSSPDFKFLVLKESKSKNYPTIADLLDSVEREESIRTPTEKSNIPRKKPSPPNPLSQLWERGSRSPLSQSWERGLGGEGQGQGIRAPIKPKDALLYLYTSGTTGSPKGLLLSHAKVIAIGRGWRKVFSITEDDKCYTLAPLFRSPALLSVMIAGLYYGITMVIPPTFRPQHVWQEVAAENASFFHACPFHFAVLANMPAPEPLSLPEFKLCYSSGNRIPPKIAEAFEERFGITIDERYGTSEVGGICRNGFPLDGVHIKLLDEEGKRIFDTGGIGEIVVKTPLMETQYYNLPDLSHQPFRDGWFHTGDVGKIDAEGRLKILYRKKRTFVSEGQLVHADEIERTLRRHPQVKEVRVVRDKPEPDDVRLKALVVLKEPCPEEVLLDFLRSHLASHKIPQEIEFRAELPRSWKAVIAGMEQAYPKWGEF